MRLRNVGILWFVRNVTAWSYCLPFLTLRIVLAPCLQVHAVDRQGAVPVTARVALVDPVAAGSALPKNGLLFWTVGGPVTFAFVEPVAFLAGFAAPVRAAWHFRVAQVAVFHFLPSFHAVIAAFTSDLARFTGTAFPICLTTSVFDPQKS